MAASDTNAEKSRMTTGDTQQAYNLAGAIGTFCLLPGAWNRLDVPDLIAMAASTKRRRLTISSVASPPRDATRIVTSPALPSPKSQSLAIMTPATIPVPGVSFALIWSDKRDDGRELVPGAAACAVRFLRSE
jgi:hypothetical protein